MKQRLIDADELIRTINQTCSLKVVSLSNLVDIIERRPTIDAAPKWIPCKEKLPEYLDYVLLSSPEYGLKIGARSRKSNFDSWYLNEPLDCDVWHVILSNPWYDFEDFTAWMPLPEPYKRGGEDEN